VVCVWYWGWVSCKVLRPGLVAGPVQGSGFGFWLGHRVWLGRPDQFFKKNQNDVVLVKKNKKKTKINGFVTGPWPGQPGHTEFFLPLFFHQLGPVPAPGRPAGPGRVSKLWSRVCTNTCVSLVFTISSQVLSS